MIFERFVQFVFLIAFHNHWICLHYTCIDIDALSSHAASQNRPSTIRGVSVLRVVREGGIITAMNVGWMPAMGATLFIVKFFSKLCNVALQFYIALVVPFVNNR